MISRVCHLALILALSLGFGCGAAPASGTLPGVTQHASVADPDFLKSYAQTGAFRSGRPANIKIVPGGEEILFLRSGPQDNERNLYAYNVESKQERVLLTAQQILQGATEELSDEEKAKRERLRLSASGIASYALSKDGSQILVPLSGKLYVVGRTSGKTVQLPSDGGYANDPGFSPDGSKVACVRQGNLFVIDIAKNTQAQLTSSASETIVNGLPEFVAQEEMSRYSGYWWSPDSKEILYQQTDSAAVEVLYASNPIDPSAAPVGARYPRVGTKNATVRLGRIALGTTDTKWLDWDHDAFPYLASVRWNKYGIYALVQDRAQRKEALLRLDDGNKVIIEESDTAWLNIDQSVPKWTSDGVVLWSSETSGVARLKLLGEGGRELTPPDLNYRSLLNVEDDALWISGSKDQTESHIWYVPLSGNKPAQQITSAAGVHSAVFGKNTDVWVHVSHTVDHNTRFVVRKGLGPMQGELLSLAQEPSFVPNVEYLQVGERKLNAVVVRPRNFDKAKKYPVLVSVYGGPGHAKVAKGKYIQLREQYHADHGAIVVSIDGRGTPGRGREFERAISKNVIDAPLQDQIDGLRALGTKFPEMDLSRVGIYGWSFGGYFSAMAVMRHPEIFKVGVAGAPVCDWRDYDTHYTERFMGLLEENRKGYDEASVLTYAKDLTRPLMIIHGTSDDNVYFTHAVKMSDALLRNGKAHEFIPLAGSTHMVADPAVSESLNARIIRFLLDNLD